ncbi:hypothetical protein [Burkholderia multivorans]|uniref:hypothetical protein n=1 Tax=Burkholderia multivorans TaxID=87883 RepID=UPI0020B2AD98|nr:hypothetical protein [Burkholderia multivorans]
MHERESKSEVDEFADFCQAVARNLRAQNPDIKSVDVFSSIAFSLWREKVMPVRNGVIEECAKVCEMERDALRKNEAVWDANPNLRPDEDYVSEWEASACRGEEYAAAIRTLKTAPTSDKGGA